MGRSDRTMSLAQLKEEKKETIEKFRAVVADILTPGKDSDHYLMKWLIARNFNIEKAEEMLRKHVWYMKVNELDKITPDFKQLPAAHYFFTAMLGYDNEGSIVRILKFGATDLKRMTLAMNKMDAIKNATYVIISDIHRQKMEKDDTACEKQVFIMDFDRVEWRNLAHRLVVERTLLLLKVYEANHPENLKVAYLVNGPSFFHIVYRWIKTVLPETIVSKVEVLSQEDCPEVLGRTIDLSILPVSVGGLRRDPDGDPTCPSLFPIPPGTPVPDELMPKDQFDLLLKDPGATRIVVESRSSYKVEKVITVVDSVLQWDVQTIQTDIRLGINFKKDDSSDTKVVIPVHKIESQRIPDSGRFVCIKPGIYEVIFDNTYSWMTKKELFYKVNVILPNSNEEY